MVNCARSFLRPLTSQQEALEWRSPPARVLVTTELLEGEELRAQLESGALPARRALEYALQITEGLADAHEEAIVHRDLKPENLFVTKDGRVKILDFGLAKLRPPQPGAVDSHAPTQKRLTDPGVVMGTVGYMSPEQVRGQETDHRADIFAFGVILYEMLSGERPFRRDSTIEMMNAILKEEPPELGETNAKISPQLEKLVRRCLEKQPERRFQSASDLGFALEALSTPSGTWLETQAAAPVAPERAGWSLVFGLARLAWAVAAVLLIGMLGFAWAYFTRQPAPDARVMRFSILPPEKASFGHTAVSPDGNWLAFTAATGTKVQLWVRALASSDAKPFEGAEGATHPFWSPDSRFIGFFAGGKLKKVEVNGGLPATLCDVGVGTGGSWNHEGVILFSALGGGGISRVPATGGAPVNIRRTDVKRQETDAHGPYFLPDGRHFLYVVISGEREVRGIYLGSLDGGVQQRLLGDPSNAVYATSSGGGGYLLFRREGALMAQSFDAKTLRLGGEPVTIAGQVGILLGTATSYRHMNLSVSDNGLLVFDPLPKRWRTQTLWVDRSGRTINPLDKLENTTVARLAPDDRGVAFSRVSPQDNYSDVWLSDVAGGNVDRFTFDPANDQFPIWSPDGSRIVWSSNRNGYFNLYEKNADNMGQDALLLQSEYFKFPTDWSRDGRYIIYRQIDPTTRYDLWVLPLFGERKPFPFLQTANNEAMGVVSPDGQWLAYASDESGRYEVYVEGFPGHGGKRQVSTAGGGGPQWRGDGKELYYHAPDGKLMAASVTSAASLNVGAPVALFEFRASNNLSSPYYSVTRDGQRFLLSAIVETEPNAPLTVVVNWAPGAPK